MVPNSSNAATCELFQVKARIARQSGMPWAELSITVAYWGLVGNRGIDLFVFFDYFPFPH